MAEAWKILKVQSRSHSLKQKAGAGAREQDKQRRARHIAAKNSRGLRGEATSAGRGKEAIDKRREGRAEIERVVVAEKIRENTWGSAGTVDFREQKQQPIEYLKM